MSCLVEDMAKSLAKRRIVIAPICSNERYNGFEKVVMEN